MSGFRLLMCVDGSHAALQAARLGIRLVAQHGGELLAVSVRGRDERSLRIPVAERSAAPVGERITRGIQAVLDRVTMMAGDAAVTLETELLEGDPLRAIMHRAREWEPDMILIGRTGRSGPGSPMVGSLAMHVVEFADCPVVVVPSSPPIHGRDTS